MKNVKVTIYSKCVIDPTYKNVIWTGADMNKANIVSSASQSSREINSKYIMQGNTLLFDIDYGEFITTGYNYLSYQYNDNALVEYYFIEDAKAETEGLTRVFLRKDVWMTHINNASLKNATVLREHQKWKDNNGNYIFNLNPEPIECGSEPVVAKRTTLTKVSGSVMWCKVTVSPIPESQGLPGSTDNVYVFFVPIAEDVGNFTYTIGDTVLSTSSSLKSHPYVQMLEICTIVPFTYTTGTISGGNIPITISGASLTTITYPASADDPEGTQRAENIVCVYCSDLSKSVSMGTIQGTTPFSNGVENSGNYPYNWQAEPKLYTHLFRTNKLYNTGTYIELMNEKLQTAKTVQADVMIGDTVMQKYWISGYDGAIGSKYNAAEDNTPKYLPRFDVASNEALAANANQMGYSLTMKGVNAANAVVQSVGLGVMQNLPAPMPITTIQNAGVGVQPFVPQTPPALPGYNPNAYPLNASVNMLSDFLGTHAYYSDMLNKPASVINSNSTGAWEWKFRNGELIYEEQTYSNTDLERVSMFLYRYGYNAGRRLDKNVNLKKRAVFDYYQVSDIEISGIYNSKDLETMKNIFLAGTTIWHSQSLTPGQSVGWYVLGNGNPDA